MRTDYRVFQARNGAWVVAERRGSRERLVGRHADKDAAIRDRDRRAREYAEANPPAPRVAPPRRGSRFANLHFKAGAVPMEALPDVSGASAEELDALARRMGRMFGKS